MLKDGNSLNSFIIEPKPPRSASQDERSGGGCALWNEERATIPPIQHISNIPGLNLSLTSAGDFLGGVGGNVNENECVLHVICSPLVSAVNIFKLVPARGLSTSLMQR